MEEKQHHRISLSRIFTGCFVSVVLFSCFVILVIIARPPAIWNGVVSFLNNGVEINSELDVTAEEATDNLKSQVNIGQSTVILTEEEATAIARSEFKELSNLTIDFEEGSMRVYWIIDKTLEDNPMLGYAEIEKSVDSIEVTKFGTPRIQLPYFINKTLSSAVLAILTFGKEGSGDSNLISNLISTDQNFEIVNFVFKEDLIEITINFQF